MGHGVEEERESQLLDLRLSPSQEIGISPPTLLDAQVMEFDLSGEEADPPDNNIEPSTGTPKHPPKPRTRNLPASNLSQEVSQSLLAQAPGSWAEEMENSPAAPSAVPGEWSPRPSILTRRNRNFATEKLIKKSEGPKK